MEKSFIEELQKVRTLCGFGFQINSGFRCSNYNRSIGSSDKSAHIRGFAADIGCTNSRQRFSIVKHAILVGFNRIGIASDFVHLDNDPDLPSNVYWIY